MTTAYVYDPRHMAHAHNEAPESPIRVERVLTYLQRQGELDGLLSVPVAMCPWEYAAAVHTGQHLDAVRRWAATGRSRASLDTFLTPVSPDAALISASAAVTAVRVVLDGQARNTFSLMRPPGHHALPTRAMGYCIFNNVAIAAAYALKAYGLRRVMIVDLDAHHGNGTQEVFYASPEVLFVSLHQYPWFPGSGDWTENGVEAGLGYTYNVPMPQWAGDATYLRAFDQLLEPLAARYQPDIILVSAGFDAHWLDHSSVLGLSVRGYYELIARLRGMAESVCGGRLVLVLEGGYNLDSLSASVQAALRAMRQSPPQVDPFGLCPDRPVCGIDDVLARLVGFMQLMDPDADFFSQNVVVPYPVKSEED